MVWLLACAFVGVAGSVLPSLEYAFDEGVYIQQARAIASGERIYVDFFSHQPPLLPLTLALPAALGAESVVAFRLPSLVALALCGVVIHGFMRRLGSPAGAPIAMLLFYAAPLHYYDLLALPYAYMLLLSTLGLRLIWSGSGRGAVASGAACLGLAFLFKPIAIAGALGLGLALLGSATGRAKLAWASVAGACTLGGAWLLLDTTSDGVFSELVMLQGARTLEGGGFELFARYPDIAVVAERHGIESSMWWNVREHVQTLLAGVRWGSPWPFFALGLIGQLLLWTRVGHPWREHRAVLTLSWLVPLGFSILVWEPTFQSYFVQYLPALSILGALPLLRLGESLPWRGLGRASVAGIVAACLGLGAASIAARRLDPELLPARPATEEAWLLFDPMLNFMTATRPGCALIDPFNVYGERGLVAFQRDGSWARFHVDDEALIACLSADPGIRIGLGYWSSWFMSERLASYLDDLPDERFVPMRLSFRRATDSVPESPPRLRRR